MIPHPIDRHAQNAEDGLAPVARDEGIVAREGFSVVVRTADPKRRGVCDLDGSSHRARPAKAREAGEADTR